MERDAWMGTEAVGACLQETWIFLQRLISAWLHILSQETEEAEGVASIQLRRDCGRKANPISCLVVADSSKSPLKACDAEVFFFFWPFRATPRTLVPWPTTEPVTLNWKHDVLTAGPPRKSC